ncbi:PAS-domain containing protein [Fulvimarina sp. 2208YS6-2-32]|uniref:histidine kinase n=1 Tax=Fulvimarina uroteuthidis TaxID=3098149 RepID=A0ABU5I6Y8_9HYPH|nr:ATP-binding protein [Fulvimarina sp. 2208YS6-2-32]MDY8110513.1 PAS-domain containing protein [Fulvimarina sp. 2208YS6-2-32]
MGDECGILRRKDWTDRRGSASNGKHTTSAAFAESPHSRHGTRSDTLLFVTSGGLGLSLGFISATPAHAQSTPFDGSASVTILALIAIAVGVAMVCAVYLMQYRAALTRENDALIAKIKSLDQTNNDLTAILSASDQRLLAYKAGDAPRVFGELPKEAAAPHTPQRFLEFADWLPSDAAGELAVHIERLIDRATPFLISLHTRADELIEVDGRTHGDLALVRFTHMAGLRAKLQRAGNELAEALGTVDTMQALLDTVPIPAWLRDGQGRLFWVNQAYSAAVEGGSPEDTIASRTEFLGETDRLAVAAAVREHSMFTGKLSTVVNADRHIFEITEIAGPLGSAGLAIDISDTENIRRELRQTIESQSETLDKLATAVARFDPDTRLAYNNAAFKELFGLKDEFLNSDPDHVAFLDHLRHAGVLPTETAFPSQRRQEDLAAYKATGPTETMWHLKGGKTLRVVATPHPQGGATFVFEDITERLKLEMEVKTVAQLQRETLDYLGEGVAVFGSDGRLRLSNPIFGTMFGLDESYLETKPRIQTFGELAKVAIELGPASGDGWHGLSVLVTSIDEMGRDPEAGEIQLSSGLTLAYKAVPLPNAQTMLTFSDVSDARAAERMLLEKNDALEEANRIKYDFVSFMSYELRSPLTTVIGFSQLLGEPELGSLNPRQSEYLEHINSSTRSLLAMVNDTLDLATIDANIMELEVSTVDIASRVENAVEGVQERLHENDLKLRIDLERSGGAFEADGARLTQILYNLLSNAANFAPQGSEIALAAYRSEDEAKICFAVTDRGPGIPAHKQEKIFERFEANAEGGRSSGPGLGLSIVKSLVELHGGKISVETPEGGGTRIVCALPARQTGSSPQGPVGSDATGQGKPAGRSPSSYRDAAE